MTAKELNKAVATLNSEIYRMSFEPLDIYLEYLEKFAKAEFTRLYGADDTMESLSKRNILVMFRLNLKHRFIPFHNFGLFIKLFNQN